MRKSVITGKNINKEFNIYKNSRERIRGALFHRHNGYTKQALSNVSFDIKKGETVALFGNRACGRTTLIRIISGITNPTSGKCTVHGKITYVQGLTYGFDLELTGRKNIYIKGATLGIPKDELLPHEQEIIEFAELEDVIDMPMKSYKVGYASRLGFSIIAAFQPEILVIDDPLSFGDVAFRQKCLRRVKELTEKKGCTLLITNNSPSTLKLLCDRMLLMEEGEIVFDGTPKDAFAEYRKKYKKRVAGSSNEAEAFDSDESEDEDDLDEI